MNIANDKEWHFKHALTAAPRADTLAQDLADANEALRLKSAALEFSEALVSNTGEKIRVEQKKNAALRLENSTLKATQTKNDRIITALCFALEALS